MKKILKQVLVIVAGLSAGYFGYSGYLIFTNEKSNVEANLETDQLIPVSNGLVETLSIENNSISTAELEKLENLTAIDNIEDLPVLVEKVFEEEIKIANDNTISATHLVNEKEKSVIIIKTTEQEIIPVDNNIEIIGEYDGKPIKYYTNGIYQFAYFQKNNQFYQLEFKKSFDDESKKFTIKEILNTVNSIN